MRFHSISVIVKFSRTFIWSSTVDWVFWLSSRGGRGDQVGGYDPVEEEAGHDDEADGAVAVI